MSFQSLKKFLGRIEKINPTTLFEQAFNDADIQREIIYLVTIDQLYEEGEDGDGKSLGDYRPYTIAYKKDKGQRFDHVTLNDSGEFYDSVRIEVGQGVAEILANYVKGKDDLRDKYNSENLLKPNEENLKYITEMVRKFILLKLAENLLR